MFDADGGNKSVSALLSLCSSLHCYHNAFSVAAFGEPRAEGGKKETEIGGGDRRDVLEVVRWPLADVAV